MYTPQQTRYVSHRHWQHRVMALFGTLALVTLLSTYPGGAAPEVTRADEVLIIAVDVSRSMRTKLPAVKQAVQTLVDGLDLHRQYRAVLVRFGTTTEQVAELDLDGEVARRVFQSAVQNLRADQQWTHFDELVTYLQRKAPGFGASRISTLLYSDGLCSMKPGSGKRCPDLASLGTLVPLSGFNVYLVRITNTPHAQEPTGATTDGAARLHVIEAKLETLTDITRGIVQRLEAPTAAAPEPEHVPGRHEDDGLLHQRSALPLPPGEAVTGGEGPQRLVKAPHPKPLPEGEGKEWGGQNQRDNVRAAPAAATTLPEEPARVSPASSQPEPAPESRLPETGRMRLILLGLGAMGGLCGILWWCWHFRPFTLVLALDGKTHEVLIDTVPAAVCIGPTLGCDVFNIAMPAPCSILVQRQAIQLEAPSAWGVWSGETQKLPLHDEGALTRYPVVYGELLRLTTPGGDHCLSVDSAPATPAERDDGAHDASPLHVLGIR